MQTAKRAHLFWSSLTVEGNSTIIHNVIMYVKNVNKHIAHITSPNCFYRKRGAR